MLTRQTYQKGPETANLLPWQVMVKNTIACLNNAPTWQPAGERFQLIANESAKVGQPVNRDEALYWIEIAKVRALAAGEVIGWVKIEENTEALAPVEEK